MSTQGKKSWIFTIMLQSRILVSQDISPKKPYTLFHKHFKQYHVLQLWWSWTRIEHSSVPPERTALYCIFVVLKIFIVKRMFFFFFFAVFLFFLRFSVESALLNRVHYILTLDGAPISTNHRNRSKKARFLFLCKSCYHSETQIRT